YDYDFFGRLAHRETLIDGKSFVSNFSYDNYGNLTGVNYNNRFSYENQYDQNGFLEKVITNSGQPFFYTNTVFDAGAVNGNGQFTSYTLGNGLTTTKTYD